ncbi:hypothetical protein ACFOHS_18130 [Jhaorihella thermophila]
MAEVQFMWPAPHRFRAFGNREFRLQGRSAFFPLSIALKEPGKPVRLRARVNMLTCAQVCIPQDFALSLDLGPGDGIDRASADRIAAWAARVPTDGNSAGIALQHAALETAPEPALVVVLRSDRPFRAPDIFPEMSEDTTFAAPDIRLGDGGRLLWARIPFTNFDDAANSVAVTVTDGHRAASLERTALGAQVPPPPYERAIAGASLGTLLNMAIVALIGGLILNVMPCVLPVLSVKLSSAMKVGAQGAARVRAGFLMASAGIIAFMWALAGVTLALRQAGLSVGWGIQFQNPVFPGDHDAAGGAVRGQHVRPVRNHPATILDQPPGRGIGTADICRRFLHRRLCGGAGHALFGPVPGHGGRLCPGGPAGGHFRDLHGQWDLDWRCPILPLRRVPVLSRLCPNPDGG